MAPLTKRKRDSESSDDERRRKISMFKAHYHSVRILRSRTQMFKEMRKKRREQADALDTYRAIISASEEFPSRRCLIGSQVTSYSVPEMLRLPLRKTIDRTLEMLSDDCLLRIMEHTRLMPDLCNFLTVSNRCQSLWSASKGSTIRGIQRTQFPEYLRLFGEIGWQSNEQVYNLLCAQATMYYRSGNSFPDPERRSFMRYYQGHADQYVQHFFSFLETLDAELNEQVKSLEEFVPLDSSSPRVGKAAVITLWRMGWKRPRWNGKWVSGPRIHPSFDPYWMSSLLEQQSEEVRERIKCIMSVLSHEIVNRSADLYHCASHWILHQQKQEPPLVPYDPHQWVAKALNGIIPIEIIFEGIGKALAALRQGHTPHVAHRQTFLDQCYRKMGHDRTGYEDFYLCYLKSQLYIARKLGVSFFWEDLVEVWGHNLGGCTGVICSEFPSPDGW